MNAVDTNVVVRLLTDDDPTQTAQAEVLFAAGGVWISKTVLLESYWVLKRLHGFDDSSIRGSLTKMLGLKGVEAEDAKAVAAALDLMSHGIDFADALHLASTPAGIHFMTFDKPLIRRAHRAGYASIGSPNKRS